MRKMATNDIAYIFLKLVVQRKLKKLPEEGEIREDKLLAWNLRLHVATLPVE